MQPSPFLTPVTPPAERAFYTYMLQCADGTFYTGWTTNVGKRMLSHNNGKGARYTRNRCPVQLVGVWRFASKSEAMRFEYWLKQLPRQEKLTFLPDRKPLPFQFHETSEPEPEND